MNDPVPEKTWVNRGETPLYESDWMNVYLADVALPDGGQVDHHLVRMPARVAGTVVHRPGVGILMLYRHRFIPDTWGWEIPAGRVDPGEELVEAAARETEEETGWRPAKLRLLTAFHPTSGLSDQRFTIYVAEDAAHVGDPTDLNEAAEVRWFAPDEVRAMLVDGRIVDGLTATAVAIALATDAIS